MNEEQYAVAVITDGLVFALVCATTYIAFELIREQIGTIEDN